VVKPAYSGGYKSAQAERSNEKDKAIFLILLTIRALPNIISKYVISVSSDFP
jgi:hypothetical protein